MTLPNIPVPTERLSPQQARALTEISRHADAFGIVHRSLLSKALARRVQLLVERHYILPATTHFLLTQPLALALRREQRRNEQRQELGLPPDLTVQERLAEILPASSRATGPRLTRSEYLICLTRALQADKVSSSLHSLLTLLAITTARQQHPTISEVCDALGCSYHSILHHVTDTGNSGHRKASGRNSHFFHLDRQEKSTRLSISPEGAALLVHIDEKVKRYAAEMGVAGPQKA